MHRKYLTKGAAPASRKGSESVDEGEWEQLGLRKF
jgi:hypothetical protein